MRSAAFLRLALVGALGTVLVGCPAPQKGPPPPVVDNNAPPPGDPPPPNDPPPNDPPDDPPPVDQPPVGNNPDVVGQFAQISDKMCACADRACAESVNKEFDEWLRANESAKGSKSEQERAKKIAERYTRCMMAAMTGKAPALPAQTEKCGDGDACADGLTCLTYYGIAGKRGPAFKSCEIPCGKGKPACPDGQRCATIADGPGQVCRATR